MKVLYSKYHDSEWNSMKVVSLRISELWASVPKADVHKGKEFYKPVLKDIEKNGLHFPLLIVEATYTQLEEQKKKYKDKMMELPSDSGKMIKVVWGGSNRVRIAEELGYTHIDCVVYKDGLFDKARRDQRLHRQPYKGKYY